MKVTNWLLESDEPWTRYRTLLDLLDRPEDDADVQAARAEMLAHPQVQEMIAEVATWPGYALKRHNDAKHPLYKFSTLADFGVRADDPGPALSGAEGMPAGIEAVMAHQSPEGAFQLTMNIHERYGGTGEDTWTWMLCDAPTLLYALLAMGLGDDPRVRRAVEHLAGLVDDNGWRCVVAPELGKFRGPGRKADPCPIGIGTTFRKLKYPFVWYDVLHVVDVLSRFPFVHADPRFQEMVETITAQADGEGRYTAGSMYRAWKGWSFADKKNPSPWLTFLVLRVQRRIGRSG
jgi:hypothetical protein